MLLTIIILFVGQFLSLVDRSNAHGYLADPPARSSAWLFDNSFISCCQYFNHMEMNCGGVSHQWAVEGGKCTICGEAYDLKPHLLGKGDAMYLGKIVRTYTQGAVIPVTVVLTANHKGVFQFRICNTDTDPSKDATQECLDLNLLDFTNNSTDYSVDNYPSYSTVQMNVTLPPTLVCKHCVFQWKYITGNSWGVSNGKACLGCGKQNEEFYGCADVAIVSEVEAIIDSSTNTNTTTTIATTTGLILPSTPATIKCTSAVVFSQSFDLSAIMNQYCQTVCASNCAPDKLAGNNTLYQGCVSSCAMLCICR